MAGFISNTFTDVKIRLSVKKVQHSLCNCYKSSKSTYTLPKIFQRYLAGIFSIIQLKEEKCRIYTDGNFSKSSVEIFTQVI